MKFSKSFVEWVNDPNLGFHMNDLWDVEKQIDAGAGKLELLYPWDVILEYALKQDEKGVFPHATVTLSAPKKSGKTLMSASIVAWYAECAPEGTEIFICANSEDQSVRLIFKDLTYHFNRREGVKVLKDRILLDNGTIIQVLTRNYTSNAGGRHALVVFDELWGGCVSSDTECFTRSGWRSYLDLEIGEEIATINPDTLELEWNPIQNVSEYNYRGDMYKLNHRRADMLITPNHRVFGKYRPSGNISLNDPDVKYEFRRAKEVVDTYEGRLSVQAKWTGNGKTTYTVPSCEVPLRGSNIGSTVTVPETEYPAEWFLKLFGYYIAEGNVAGISEVTGLPSSFWISQRKDKHPDEYDRIEECLIKLELDYRLNEKGFSIKDGQLAQYFQKFGHAHEKYIPWQIKDYDTKYLRGLFDSFIDGDGWISGNIQTEISSLTLLDDLVEIGLKLGYTPRYMGSRNRDHVDKRDGKLIRQIHDTHRASFSTGHLSYHKKNWETVEYDGKVWCPTVKNGTWLARMNGNVFWTGNTSDDDYRRYDELTPVPMIPHSLQLITSYAGFYGESQLLYDIYLNSVGVEELEDGKGVKVPELKDLPCYHNGDAYFAYWDHEPRMPWQTEEYYRKQATTLRDSAYVRLHENRWVTSNETFFPIEWWDMSIDAFREYCVNWLESREMSVKEPQSADLWVDHPYRKNPVFVAIDTGMKHDCTAVVGVTTDPREGKGIVLFHKIWVPVEGEILDLGDTVKPYIIGQMTKYNIVDVTCDPSQMLQTMNELRDKHNVPVSEFTQSENKMIGASQALFDLLHDQNLWAYESDELRDHLRNSIALHTSKGFRIVKDKSNRRVARKKVDAAIAMAMAFYKAIENMDFDAGEVITIDSPFGEYSSTPAISDKERELPWQLRD